MEKSSHPRIYGLIGYPVKHSLSPVMHNAAFRALKINAEYRLFEVKPEELQDFLLSDKPAPDIDGNLIPKSDIFGFNITIPHKVEARQILEKTFPLDNTRKQILENEYYVRLSGAVNTVKKDGNKLLYYNTDASGFLRSLEHDLKFDTKNKNVLLIGCGGAGRAVIASLSWDRRDRGKIYINDISKEAITSAQAYFSQLALQFEHFEHLKDKLQFIPTEEISKVIKDCHLLVNATPIGMKGEDISVVNKSLLHENLNLYVYDIVYNKKGPTRLIKEAESLNLIHASGLDMLLYQGADAFELWIARQAPIDIMRQALMEEAQK